MLNPTENSSGSSRISSGIADFRDCVEYSGLFDLSIRGSEFTWWNKQAASPIAKKLDRILINDLWQLKFPTSFAHFGSPDFSDHSPSCLILGDRVKTKNTLWFPTFCSIIRTSFPGLLCSGRKCML